MRVICKDLRNWQLHTVEMFEALIHLLLPSLSHGRPARAKGEAALLQDASRSPKRAMSVYGASEKLSVLNHKAPVSECHHLEQNTCADWRCECHRELCQTAFSHRSPGPATKYPSTLPD